MDEWKDGWIYGGLVDWTDRELDQWTEESSYGLMNRFGDRGIEGIISI